MIASPSLISLPLFLASCVLGDSLLGFKVAPEIETRTLDEIHKAALAEGGVVTLWHGGDEANQQDALKQAFEQRFPGMTLNVTVDLSKYHDARLDQQIATGKVSVDSIILQTVHDYPRWADEGVLLNYAPVGFDAINDAVKDSSSAAYYGLFYFLWQTIYNTDKLGNISIVEFDDFLKPELKNKLVFTYPNDDDAVLFAFELILQQYGIEWFDALLKQNPRWVRGTATPSALLTSPNETVAATFTSFYNFNSTQRIKTSFPTKAQFVSWPQTGAILKDAPHPEGAKLLHNYLLSPEYQVNTGWPIRYDVPLDKGFPLPPIQEVNSTNPTTFIKWMANRERVERLRFWFEDRIGSAQGLSPLHDDL